MFLIWKKQHIFHKLLLVRIGFLRQNLRANKYSMFEKRLCWLSTFFFFAGSEEAGHSDQVRGQETDHQAGESEQSGTVSSYKRSDLSLILQTPSKSFRHYTLPWVVWGGMWKWNVSQEFVGLHMEKSFFQIFSSQYTVRKLYWFQGKHIGVDGNINICSQGQGRQHCFV